MPLRISPFRAAALHFPAAPPQPQQHHRHRGLSAFFHSTRARGDDIDDKTHYEILQVQPGAHASDVKRSFYALSKAHHPDHNRDDPAASKRFMRISEAYSVLSDAERRARYDRDVLRLHDQRAHHGHHGHHGHHRGGSYSSTGPAGGRPASGLSRRRGSFHGPPPSFYRNGGWGAHGAKRSQAHEETTAGTARHAQKQQQQQQHQGEAGASASGDGFRSFGGGMGPEQDPFGRGAAGAAGDMPHFDRAARAAHTRTQARSDERRARRLAREYHFPSAGDWGESGSFLAVLGVLGVAIGLPYLVTRGWNTAAARKEKKKKKDWNKTAAG